jgi:hypothetical protein
MSDNGKNRSIFIFFSGVDADAIHFFWDLFIIVIKIPGDRQLLLCDDDNISLCLTS